MVLLLIALWHRTADNKRRTGIVNQHTIHLIYHGIMVFALHHFIGVVHHIITQVIKAKFVIGSVDDIGHISLAAGFAVGLMFIDAIHAQAKPFEDGAVPFTVASCQVIIHSYKVHAFAR